MLSLIQPWQISDWPKEGRDTLYLNKAQLKSFCLSLQVVNTMTETRWFSTRLIQTNPTKDGQWRFSEVLFWEGRTRCSLWGAVWWGASALCGAAAAWAPHKSQGQDASGTEHLLLEEKLIYSIIFPLRSRWKIYTISWIIYNIALLLHEQTGTKQ